MPVAWWAIGGRRQGRARPRKARGGPLRGAVYARYSSRFQHSIKDQFRSCLDWADRNEVTVERRHIFRDKGVTGKRSRRRGLNLLQKALAAGEIDVLIVFSTNRLFRKMHRSLQFVEEEVVERGIRCVFISNNIDTDDAGRWRQALGFSAMMDEFVVQGMAAHIQAAHETMLLSGRVCTTLAFGYRGEPISGVTTKLGRPGTRVAVDPDTSIWVQRVFEWFVRDGVSIQEIVRRLNQQGAPRPPKVVNGRWTYQAVRHLLGNARYRGWWEYGRTMSVWQSSKDYVRQVEREEALRSIQVDDLRLIDDATWHAAQAKLHDYRDRVGRRKKATGKSDVACVISGLLICHQHQRSLTVAGTNGKFLACPDCKSDGEGELFSMLPRDLALQLICERLADELKLNDDLIDAAIASAQRQMMEMEQPDTTRVPALKKRVQTLAGNIEFVLSSPGETDEDQAENRATLQRLRSERAKLRSEIAKLEAAANNPPPVPTEHDLRALLGDLAGILHNAANSETDRERAVLRELIRELTGGRIVVTQQGERRKYHGWLPGTFSFGLPKSLAAAGVPADATGAVDVIEIDFRRPSDDEQLGDAALKLFDDGLLMKEIGTRLGVSRNRATRLLRAAMAKDGRVWRDGRGRAAKRKS